MKKLIISVVICMFCIQPSIASNILNKEGFAKKYVEVLNKKHPDFKATLVATLEVKIVMPDETELTSYLDNAYQDYNNDKENLVNILDTYIGSLSVSTNLNKMSFGKEHIFPVMKDRSYIEETKKMFASSGKKGLIYEKLNDVLYVVFAFDTPKAIRFLTEDDLKKVGVEVNELRGLAKTNLKSAISKIQLKGDPSIYSMLIADGTYEASFLLFDDMWTKQKFPVNGDIVVYVPSRELLLITGSKDKVSLKKIHNIVYDEKNLWPHAVAKNGFIRINDKWEVFRP